MPGATPHERDVLAWTEDQARRLRAAAAAGSKRRLDFANLAEECESLGRAESLEAVTRLVTLLEHRFKLRLSAAEALAEAGEPVPDAPHDATASEAHLLGET